MRILASTFAALLLLVVIVVQGQAPEGEGKAKAKGGGKGKGGGFVAKNLQVLPQANLPLAMQSYVQALGLLDKGVCNYCHVEDRSSDEKMQKLTARNMILMVREINARFPDGKQYVTCYTCHRVPLPSACGFYLRPLEGDPNRAEGRDRTQIPSAYKP